MRLWILSNGRGEDRAASLIASELLQRRPGLQLAAAPLISAGEAFAARGVPTPITGCEPPSGGFPTASPLALLRDLPALRNHFTYVGQLRQLATRGDRFLSVGDVFLTGLARLAIADRGVHIALAKSVYARPHSLVEHHLLRRWTRLVFARDQPSADDLERRGVRAVFVGNPLVDGLAATCEKRRSDDRPTVVLLPGSRVEAPANLLRLLQVARHVDEPSVWSCAWPQTMPIESAMRAAAAAGWTAEFHPLQCSNGISHLFGAVQLSQGSSQGRTVVLGAGAFESMLAAADVVVGLAGSANEQAAAAGKPVVTMVGCGPQTTAARMREQERLLGGAARFVAGTPADAAAEVSSLLRSPEQRARLGQLGIARLGPPGGAARIAERLIGDLGL